MATFRELQGAAKSTATAGLLLTNSTKIAAVGIRLFWRAEGKLTIAYELFPEVQRNIDNNKKRSVMFEKTVSCNKAGLFLGISKKKLKQIIQSPKIFSN